MESTTGTQVVASSAGAAAAPELYKSLRIVRTVTATGRPWLKVWRGRQSRPFVNFTFSTAERMEAHLAEVKAGEDRREAAKAKRAAERRAVVNQFKVGDVVHHSWGYDQTNCDFYQVVAVTAKTVTVRAIGSEVVAGSEGFMSDRRVARVGSFLDKSEPVVKRIAGSGDAVCVEHGWADKWDGRPEYCSWYA